MVLDSDALLRPRFAERTRGLSIGGDLQESRSDEHRGGVLYELALSPVGHQTPVESAR